MYDGIDFLVIEEAKCCCTFVLWSGIYSLCRDCLPMHMAGSDYRRIEVDCRKPIQLLVGNKSAINLSKNPISHDRSKHIETKFHYLIDQVNKRRWKLVYCPTKEQIADVFTKGLRQNMFERLRDSLGVKSLESFVLEGCVECKN